MSYIIIVKVERLENGELRVHNFDGRYEQRMALTDDVERMLGRRTTMFAEARLKPDGQIIILRRGRERDW